MSRHLDARDDLIVEYLRSRGRVDVPPDLVLSVVDAARTLPQQRATWFGAFLPAVAAVASIALVVIVAGLLSQQPSTGPSPSTSNPASLTPSSPASIAASPRPGAATPAEMIAGPASCQDEGTGLSVPVPEGWYTNGATSALPGCHWFAREPFEATSLDREPSAAAITIDFDRADVVVPQNPLLQQETTMAGHPALRLELRAEESEGDGGPDPRLYLYVADVGGSDSPPSLRIVTSTGRPGDYSENRKAVDQLAATLTLSLPKPGERMPELQASVHETNDVVTDVTFNMGYSDGIVVYSDAISRDELGTSGWFGPYGERFVRIGFDGRAYSLSVLDLADGSPREIRTDEAQILAATLSPDGKWVYFTRTDATSGQDLGVWRQNLTTADVAQILKPNPARPTTPSQRGSTFTWTPGGALLVVQHCRGDRGDDCTWTLISNETGDVAGEVVPQTPAGLILGVANDRLLAGRNCDGQSCSSSLVDFETGSVTSVEGADTGRSRETLIESDAGPLLIQDNGALASRYRITATELETGRSWTAYETGGPGRVLVTLERGFGGVELDQGWFALAQEGQLATRHHVPPMLVNAVDQRQIELANLGQ